LNRSFMGLEGPDSRNHDFFGPANCVARRSQLFVATVALNFSENANNIYLTIPKLGDSLVALFRGRPA
jgi:hypothetical protein